MFPGAPPLNAASSFLVEGAAEARADIRVVLVDHHAIFRRGIRGVLDREDGIAVVGEAADAQDGLEQTAKLDPDIVLMAVRLPGVSGIEATQRLLASATDCRVVMLTASDRPEDIEQAILAGASGYVVKDAGPREIASAIRTTAAGESHLSPRIAATILKRFRDKHPPAGPDLTARERPILELLADGRSNPEIAEGLGISVQTVKEHVSRLLEKLGAENRTQAAAEAVRRGLV
jgi:DNA-binding NarL/FixJ family response regulator